MTNIAMHCTRSPTFDVTVCANITVVRLFSGIHFLNVKNKRSFLKFYIFRSGVGTVIARNGPSNTIFFMLREPLAQLIDTGDNTTSSGECFKFFWLFNFRDIYSQVTL
jgi:hypothetical protein